MKAGVIGGSLQQRSLPFDAERTLNMFVIADQAGKENASLMSRPGLSSFAVAPSSIGRGGFTAPNGRAFVVLSAVLYEMTGAGSLVSRGTLDQSSGIVTFADNGFQLAVCDCFNLYIFTYATNAFQKVINANLPSAASVTFIDGYFVVNNLNSGRFQISALYDGFSWGALDFASAESSPDSLLRIINVAGQLFLFGQLTTEPYYNNGSAAFPFSRVSGGVMDVGTVSPYAVTALDSSVFWIGRNKQGFGIVYRADGFTPQRISNEYIERLIQSCPNPELIRSWTYQSEGHTFLVFTGGGLPTSLVYDLATQQWFEFSYLDDYGNHAPHLGVDSFNAFGQQFVVSRLDGSVYTQSNTVYSDNGREIARERIFTHLSDENQRISFKNLTVGFQTGVGLQSGQGSDPQAALYLSRDGGQRWIGPFIRPIGKVGKYRARATWQRLGQAREMTFRVRVTDPVPVAITGAYFNV